MAVEEGGGRVRGMAIADPKIGLDKVTPFGGSFFKTTESRRQRVLSIIP